MSDLTVVALVVGAYLAVALGLGLVGKLRGESSVQDYFVASRSIGPVVLFFTLAATNFSAFFFIGFAGAAFGNGWGFYGLMAFGTSLVGLALLLIGIPIWKKGRDEDYLTPPEFVAGESGSRALGLLFAAVLVVFTLPYLAVQPMGAGIILELLSDGAVTRFEGAVVLTVVMIVYLLMGGMQSSALTDVMQGVAMIVLLFAAGYIVISAFGGFAEAGQAAYAERPDLFSREGSVTVRQWISYTLLYGMVVPMFPQMFSRFYIAENDDAIRTSAWLYPVVVSLLFVVPVFLGVVGHVDFGTLGADSADDVLPEMMLEYAPLWLAATILTGAIAAFMSTADSQVLALSSILTRDVARPAVDISQKAEFWLGRLLVVVLALAGLGVIATGMAETIFETVVDHAFTGLVVLFPTTVAVVWISDVRPVSCIASIAVGQALVVGGMIAGGLPDWFLQGFHASTPVVATSALVLIAVEIAVRQFDEETDESSG